MKSKRETGTWIVREVPADLMHRTRVAALTQRKSVPQVLMEAMETHLHELERKGVLPKAK
jgi:hypothetical protein